MANLDDFFARKDRKKSKDKKFATADEIAKNLDETDKRTEKTKRDRFQSSFAQDIGETGIGNREEDEWKDFEEEKKDYSGLKIQNLILLENEGEDCNSDGEDMVENETGEMVPRKKASGPWKSVAKPQPEEPEPKPVPLKGNYLAPHLRNSTQRNQSSTAHCDLRMFKPKAAPDVNNEELFPTLSAAKSVEPEGSCGKKKRDGGIEFEEIRNSKSHSSRYTDNTNQMSSGRLFLGNKYGALNNDIN